MNDKHQDTLDLCRLDLDSRQRRAFRRYTKMSSKMTYFAGGLSASLHDQVVFETSGRTEAELAETLREVVDLFSPAKETP